jgi:hypothetical protein
MIFIEKDAPLAIEQLKARLDYLRRAVETGDDDAVREALHHVVPTFRTPSEVNADASDAEEMREAEEAVTV